MKFTSRIEIAAAPAQVFGQMSDLSVFAPELRRHGVRLRRTDTLAEPAAGMSWQADFRFRDRARVVHLMACRVAPQERIDYEGQSNSFLLSGAVALTPLPREHTRLHLTLEFRPRNLGARLLLQSARLARARLEGRLGDRLAELAALLEAGARA